LAIDRLRHALHGRRRLTIWAMRGNVGRGASGTGGLDGIAGDSEAF